MVEKAYIVTDSTAGVTEEMLNSYNIKILPLTIKFKGKEYRDLYDINEETLLNMLKKGDELPKTSQVNPNVFFETYKAILDKGYKIISIHISSGLSGTYQSACLAREMIDKKEDIYIVDSKSASFGTGALIKETIKMLNSTSDIKEVVNKVESLKKRLKVGFALDTLEYIKKGGRISSVHAAVGSLLNIKPVLYLSDGKVEVFDKVRGRKKALKRLLEYVLESKIDNNLTTGIGNIDSEDDMEEFKKMLYNENIDNIESVKVGSIISTYTGPGTIGIFFFSK